MRPTKRLDTALMLSMLCCPRAAARPIFTSKPDAMAEHPLPSPPRCCVDRSGVRSTPSDQAPCAWPSMAPHRDALFIAGSMHVLASAMRA